MADSSKAGIKVCAGNQVGCINLEESLWLRLSNKSFQNIVGTETILRAEAINCGKRRMSNHGLITQHSNGCYIIRINKYQLTAKDVSGS